MVYSGRIMLMGAFVEVNNLEKNELMKSTGFRAISEATQYFRGRNINR